MANFAGTPIIQPNNSKIAKNNKFLNKMNNFVRMLITQPNTQNFEPLMQTYQMDSRDDINTLTNRKRVDINASSITPMNIQETEPHTPNYQKDTGNDENTLEPTSRKNKRTQPPALEPITVTPSKKQSIPGTNIKRTEAIFTASITVNSREIRHVARIKQLISILQQVDPNVQIQPLDNNSLENITQAEQVPCDLDDLEPYFRKMKYERNFLSFKF